MPASPRQHAPQPKPAVEPQTPPEVPHVHEPLWNPVADGEFDKRFTAARATDDAAKAAEERKARGEPEPEPKPEAKPEPAKPEAPPKESEKPKEEPETPPKGAEKPSALPDFVKPPSTTTENLANLRKKIEAAEARAREIESSTSDELKRLRSENEELHTRIAQADLSVDPKFQSHYESQMKPAIEEAKTLVPPELADRITNIMSMPPNAERYRLLEEVCTELEPWQARRLGDINGHLVRTMQERDYYLKRAKETTAEIRARQESESRAYVEQAEAAMDAELKKVADPENGFFGFVPTDKNREEVAANVALAKTIFTRQLSISDMAKASIWAVTAPILLEQLRERDKTVAELNETIAKLKAATPSPAAGPSGEPAPDTEKEYEGLSYAESMLRRAQKSGAFER